MSDPELDLVEDPALRAILAATSCETGERFFAALVKHLAGAIGTFGAWVTEYLEGERRFRALAFWLGDDWVPSYEYDVAGTPCEPVVDDRCMVHIPDNVVSLFPEDPDLRAFEAVSYLGLPFLDPDGRLLGHLAVLDREPLPADPRTLGLFRIFADRAAAELRRVKAEEALRQREESLARLLDGAMDAIVELDRDLRVVQMNAAARRSFALAEDAAGEPFRRWLSSGSGEKVARIARELEHGEGPSFLWIPGGLEGRRDDGEAFPADATLSHHARDRRTFFTLVLRDVNERIVAERRIRALRRETEFLREELGVERPSDRIVGESRALMRALEDVRQVAGTDASVLVTGETGTGKELFARAIHAESARCEGPFVKVNCAALPANLVESELFGHERGAFTGATRKREGRFTLADGGTIFLDEVGELPLELQAKLLRVLQEGELEPVGSSRTEEVDVRVIAATNRDLSACVREGTFREDLFYRLNVFPLALPPLRERAGDVPLLAEFFLRRFAERSGRTCEPLPESDRRRLAAYDWPGNVRELENVVERAMIVSRDGRPNLDRALPGVARSEGSGGPPARILTTRELRELERENMLKALEACDWQVSGHGGAATLLGLSPSTLGSRMKAMGVRRPG